MLEKEGELNADKGRYIDSTKRNDTENKGGRINKIGTVCGWSVCFVVFSRF
jgi:hypothetical protein